jgi:hypothetical protein
MADHRTYPLQTIPKSSFKLKKEEFRIKKVIDDLQLYGCDIEVVYPTTRRRNR